MHSILKSVRQIAIVLIAVLLCTSCTRGFLPSISYNPWEVVPLPTEETLADVAFADATHGWLVGVNSTLLETKDGGETWEQRSLDLGDSIYTFSSVSFADDEGWIVGQPGLLLHTTDGGNSWSRIPLSEKLPGAPYMITALKPQTAEMATDVGAIYQTKDGGKTWQALVQEAVGVLRNIARSADGRYVAVSARGSFYSVWEPGQAAWQPYNRNSSRRLQNMGFNKDGGLWLLARGGTVQFNESNVPEEWSEAITPEFSTSWGLLDLTYRTPNELWVSGGSGNLLASFDGGKTWQKDREIENVPSNLYKIVFVNPEQGFVLGQRGTLLKYKAA
ncbi:photosynthesis system II assembly factor Ycf48 [Phormidium tenue FACHB-886]|nr:photosynthesis system II assembly factor Ycf48 [Phormidium tenue FACHB-886]